MFKLHLILTELHFQKWKKMRSYWNLAKDMVLSNFKLYETSHFQASRTSGLFRKTRNINKTIRLPERI